MVNDSGMDEGPPSAMPETSIVEPLSGGRSNRPEAPVDSMLKDMATIIFSTLLLAGWVAFMITYPKVSLKLPLNGQLPEVDRSSTIFINNFLYTVFSLSVHSFLSQSVHKQQLLQHQEFQRQMEERLELLQRQQPFPPAEVGLGLAQDSDYLEVARIRSECSDHSSPNVTPRASNHSNMSLSEFGSSANEHEDGGMKKDGEISTNIIK